jgi:hypothetical protein
MSPTVFRFEGFRFFFYSLEETRAHVHVQHADGEAKFWIEPEVELAENKGLAGHQVAAALKQVREKRDDIRAAWNEHFGG